MEVTIVRKVKLSMVNKRNIRGIIGLPKETENSIIVVSKKKPRHQELPVRKVPALSEVKKTDDRRENEK